MKYYLAIDLGATSGRHIVGHLENGKIKLEEIYRFKTGMDDSSNGLVWNIPLLLEEIIKGIKLSFDKYKKIESLSIDTWGVDYVLLNDKEEIPPFYAYRNERCKKSSEEVHRLIPFEELYKHTGIQFAAFNTIYQLFDDLKKGRLDQASDYLMLPCYFIYKLTGKKIHEYTNESTGALLNADKGEYDFEIIDKLGLPRKLFKEIHHPGYSVGKLLPEIESRVGGNTRVVLCPTHDTASAFEAVEVDEDTVILSSGTWSLLGIKSKKPVISDASLKANYTNEGGVNYIRLLKNIMGMWIPNMVKDEVSITQEFINKNIVNIDYKVTFDVNDPSLIAPSSMKKAVLKLLEKHPPRNDLELFSSIYRSLALSYKNAVEELENITKRKYHKIVVIGGGANNNYLNGLIKEYSDLEVIALPIEATALGNIKVQMKENKEL